MKHRYWVLAVLAAAAVLLLAGCTSADQENKAETSADQASAIAGSATIAGVGAADTQSETEEEEDQTDLSTEQSQNTAAQEADSSDADSVSAAGTADSGSRSDDTAEEDQWDVQSEAGEAEEDETEAGTEAGDDWSGTYIGDKDTVTLQVVSRGILSFSFKESGISGTVRIKDGQAVYEGDDQNNIVFQMDGSLLSVSVTSEEDYDTSESPLNGTYIRSE